MNILTRNDGQTPLIIAAEVGNDAVARELIRGGATFKSKKMRDDDKGIIEESNEHDSDSSDNHNKPSSRNDAIISIDGSPILEESSYNSGNETPISKAKTNEAFERALFNKNFNVAECILRDISLKDAINNGVSDLKQASRPCLRRQKSCDIETIDN